MAVEALEQEAGSGLREEDRRPDEQQGAVEATGHTWAKTRGMPGTPGQGSGAVSTGGHG